MKLVNFSDRKMSNTTGSWHSIKASAKVSAKAIVDQQQNEQNYRYHQKLLRIGFEPNQEQWQAILHEIDQPLLLHAGAGSGKTTTVIAKIGYLVDVKKVNPESILLLTFTNKASKEMKERITKIAPQASNLVCGTYHSVFGKVLLEQYPDLYSGRLLNEFDRRMMLRIGYKRAQLSLKDVPLDDLSLAITLYKNTGVEPDEVFFDLDPNIGKLYQCYETEKGSTRMDYDDMIINFLPYAKKFGEKFQYIFVDEFQDTSEIQMQCILDMIANEKTKFVAVGDPDQSIYSWRGAVPHYILNFREEFKGEVIKMGTNYRSHAEIVQCGINVVNNNQDREAIDLFAIRDTTSYHPQMYKFEDQEQESSVITAVLGEIGKDDANSSTSYRDIAILYRNSFYCDSLFTKLIEQKIPFRVDGEASLIYDRPVVQQVLSLLKLTFVNQDDEEALRDVLPLFYLKSDRMAELVRLAEKQDRTLLDTLPHLPMKFGQDKIYRFCRAIRQRKDSVSDQVEHYLMTYLNDHFYGQGGQGRLKIEEITIFLESIKHITLYQDLILHIEQLRNELLLAKRVSPFDDAVTLTTIHRSKGLEWNTVFLIGVVDGHLPDSRTALEEERRLCYVGITRAKERLFVSTLHEYLGKRAKSTFCDEMKFVTKC